MAEEKYTWENLIFNPITDEAKNAVGKEVYYSDKPSYCIDYANENNKEFLGVLDRTEKSNNPFHIKGSINWACIIVKKNESSVSQKKNEAPYLVSSKKWVEQNDLKVGDYVKVTRKAESREGGCDYLWNYRMDNSVGKILKVEEIKTRNGVIVLEDSCCYPYFVLEKTEPPKPKYVPFESKEEFIRTFDNHTTNLDVVSTEYALLRYGMWIKTIYSENLFQVTTIGKNGIYYEDSSEFINWELLLDEFTFLDGTPCGKEVKDE